MVRTMVRTYKLCHNIIVRTYVLHVYVQHYLKNDLYHGTVRTYVQYVRTYVRTYYMCMYHGSVRLRTYVDNGTRRMPDELPWYQWYVHVYHGIKLRHDFLIGKGHTCAPRTAYVRATYQWYVRTVPYVRTNSTWRTSVPLVRSMGHSVPNGTFSSS
jgi:hypothetical protein